jgi:arylsulfatase
MEQRAQGTLRIWAEPFTHLRVPKVFNLRMDPYERADITSNTYYDWCLHNLFFIFACQGVAAKFVETFKEFPPAQHPGTFTIDAAMAKMSEAGSGANH